MYNDIYISDIKYYQYNNKEVFNPSSIYPEGLNLNIKSDKYIYDKVRSIFINMGLDKENIGKKTWNPFGDFIKRNDKVVIKPNLVKHINVCQTGTENSLITNFSLIRPIIDYALIALHNTGSLIVGDAPVQECIFQDVIALNGLKEAIDIYNDNNYFVKLIDFRKNENPDLACTLVSLDNDSSLVDVDKYANKYAITNYDLRYMHEHHQQNKHEYLIANDVLDADVIINMPKPKSHRKAGMTACMKNFVGINSKKEYLPHHRNGSIHCNGDEYPERSLIKAFRTNIRNYNYKKSIFIKIIYKILGIIEKMLRKDRFLEGSWYGNDTIWRTILDINKIILYSSKKGIMTNKKQRIIFNVADMIVSGEKEGPLMPSDKNVGMIVVGFNQLNMDNVICRIMGFDINKIKYIKNGYKLKKYIISKRDKFNIYDENGVTDLKKYNKQFIPTDGWIDYLKKERNL